MPNTNQNTGLEKLWPLKPDTFSVFVKTKLKDWWWFGTIARTNTITTTPTMCHHAESELSNASSRTALRFSKSCAAMIALNVMKTVCVSVPTLGNQRFMSDVQKIAAP